ncbi:hypothetical protein PV783_23255 [Chitinophaga sp. CC14]
MNDPFFDSLKEDYREFEAWYEKKAKSNAMAYVSHDEHGYVQAFLYLKVESSAIEDVAPRLEEKKWLKVGTFKVNPHGTRLGERFVKKLLDHAVIHEVDSVYVTVFPTHNGLIRLLERYGFTKQAEKTTENGVEDVLVKEMNVLTGRSLHDYPLIKLEGRRKFVLSIYPAFHTQLFPDSKLFNEKYDLIQDVSHTNSIHKIYISFMSGVQALNSGDIVVIYRTTDTDGNAHYRSVVTSICVVEEVKRRRDFASINDYIAYCQSYSVFDESDLRKWFNRNGDLFIIKMTYNIALKKRLIRKVLIEDLGINSGYWGFFEIDNNQFKSIINQGEVNESIIID